MGGESCNDQLWPGSEKSQLSEKAEAKSHLCRPPLRALQAHNATI